MSDVVVVPSAMQHGQRLTRNEIHELEKKWKPPEVMVGMPIMWKASPFDGKNEILGIVASHNKRMKTVDVFLPTDSGYTREGCRHVTDPKVFGQGFDRDSGCWEYTEYYQRTVGSVAKLERRVAGLERKSMNAGKKVTAPAASAEK